MLPVTKVAVQCRPVVGRIVGIGVAGPGFLGHLFTAVMAGQTFSRAQGLRLLRPVMAIPAGNPLEYVDMAQGDLCPQALQALGMAFAASGRSSKWSAFRKQSWSGTKVPSRSRNTARCGVARLLREITPLENSAQMRS